MAEITERERKVAEEVAFKVAKRMLHKGRVEDIAQALANHAAEARREETLLAALWTALAGLRGEISEAAEVDGEWADVDSALDAIAARRGGHG